MLEILSKHNALWIRYVRSFGCQEEYVMDIVQDMYIKLNELIKDPDKIMFGNDVNKYYVYRTLRNLYLDSVTKKKKSLDVSLMEDFDIENTDYLVFEEVDLDKLESFDTLVDHIQAEINSWHPYNSRMCNLYFKTKHSLDNIANGTGISRTAIWNTINNQRNELVDKFGEDWLDFKNGDYDKIN